MHGTQDTTAASDRLRDFITAQLSGDRAAALGVVTRAMQDGASALDVYAQILEPAQVRIGVGWARGNLTVADEHMATAVTQYVMAAVHERVAQRTPARGRLVMTGVDGELHQLGAEIVADGLAADGWDVRYLGTDAPSGDVAAAIGAFDPALVGISVTMLPNVAAARDLIERVRSVTPRARILVGGGAFSAWDEIWRSIGADARAGDVRHAIVTARSLQDRSRRGSESSA